MLVDFDVVRERTCTDVQKKEDIKAWEELLEVMFELGKSTIVKENEEKQEFFKEPVRDSLALSSHMRRLLQLIMRTE